MLPARMAEGVAEIEQCAGAGLAFVGGDDLRLGAAAHRDGMAPRRLVAVDQIGAVGFQPGEEGRVADQAVFHHFGIARQQFAPRQRIQGRSIGEHQARLIETPTRFLPPAAR